MYTPEAQFDVQSIYICLTVRYLQGNLMNRANSSYGFLRCTSVSGGVQRPHKFSPSFVVRIGAEDRYASQFEQCRFLRYLHVHFSLFLVKTYFLFQLLRTIVFYARLLNNIV